MTADVAAAAATDPDAVPPGAWRTLTVSALATLAAFLDTTVLFVAFPDIVASFGDVPTSQLSWVLNAYTIVFAALLVPAGKIADRVGHKRAFLTGSAVFTIASVLCGLAPTAYLLIAFRVVQAIGAAVLLPSSLALLLRAFPPAKIPVAVAIWGAMGALAGSLGPTLGAALVDWLSWRWVFFINLPIGIVTVVAGRRVLKESNDDQAIVPAPLGIVLVIAGASLVALDLVQGDSWGWTDPRTAITVVGGLIVLTVFAFQQRVSRAPVLDMELFAIRDFRWGNAATLVFGIAFSAMFFSSILFLTEVWGYSILAAGFAVAPGPLIVALLSPRLGALAARIGQRPLIVLGGVIYALGGLWRLTMLSGSAQFWVDYFPSMLLTATGVALAIPQLSSVVAQSLPPNRFGVGGGVNQAARQFGGTIGVALTIALIAQPSSLDHALEHFDRVWWLIILGGLITSALATRLGSRPMAAANDLNGPVSEVTAA